MTHSGKLKIIAAPFTPFDADGAVQLSQIESQARYLAATGVSGAFVCGTTGEGLSLSTKERKLLVEGWKASADVHGLELIVHVGHSCLEDARALAEHAERVGANAIASMGPVFFTAANASSLAAYCGEIARAAPDTPFYYYHIPSMTRINASASEVMQKMILDMPTFAGVKFTHEDLVDYRDCIRLAEGRFDIFFGRDELFLEGLRAGAVCAVGSTYNFAAPLYRQIARNFEAGNMNAAEGLQKLCTKAIEEMVGLGGLPAIKVAMKLFGVDCGEVRLPLTPLTGAQVDSLRTSLESMAYFATVHGLEK